MVTALVIVKALIELALMFILGRAALGLLIGRRRTQNVFWQILDIAARPALWLTRAISLKWVPQRYLTVTTLAWLLLAWLAVLKLKIEACLSHGLGSCQ